MKPFTMTSVPRLYDLWKSVRYLTQAGIVGDMVECGVWRGGSMMLVAKTLLELGDTQRNLILYDTYAGHPKPDADKDVDLWGSSFLPEWLTFSRTDGTSAWAEVSVEEVAENMASTGYPRDRIILVKGMVEDTIPSRSLQRIALLRLDTDWYASTKVALQEYWPLLARSGILIIDDYGHLMGQRDAVDEYFAGRPIMMHRVDYSCRTIVKLDSDSP